MKTRFREYLSRFPEKFAGMLRFHPVEAALAAIGCAGCVIAYNSPDFQFESQLALVPVFALLALAVNLLMGHGPWRKLYWVCWLPALPLLLWPGLGVWVDSWHYAITLGVLLPLAILICRREVHNDRFVGDAFVWARSAALAVLFVNVALGLFCSILYSTTYIFGLEGAWVGRLAMHAVIFAETLAVPLLFLMMSDHWRGAECRGSRIAAVLFDYIVTPALLIYMAILYLYMAKILFTWTLPRGGVAYLVFGFMLLAIFVHAVQFLLPKRRYDWFFDRIGLISLPVLVLFWAGVVRRTGEYGLTEPRVWLIVCGGLMTLCVLLFLANRTGRYLYVCTAAFLGFGAMTFVSGLNPERIALRSQMRRAVHIADRLGLLADDGRLRLDLMSKVDTLQREEMRRLYESLQYLDRRDSAAFAGFGMPDIDVFELEIPGNMRSHVLFGDETKAEPQSIYLKLSSGYRVAGLSGYDRMYVIPSTWDRNEKPYFNFENDTLRIDFGKDRPAFIMPGDSLLQTQMRRIGMEGRYLQEERLTASRDTLLTYENEEMMILFSDMTIDRSDSVYMLKHVSIEAILIR